MVAKAIEDRYGCKDGGSRVRKAMSGDIVASKRNRCFMLVVSNSHNANLNERSNLSLGLDMSLLTQSCGPS